ncbi:hypothetical protein MyNCGM683_18960 [Achromobacter xylosoxidans]
MPERACGIVLSFSDRRVPRGLAPSVEPIRLLPGINPESRSRQILAILTASIQNPAEESRPPVAGADGATAPETLRQQDCAV